MPFETTSKLDSNDNISKNNISFYIFFRNENLQIFEFYFRENFLLKFHHKLLLDTNSAIDEAKNTSTPRIWKEICGLLFANCITKSEISTRIFKERHFFLCFFRSYNFKILEFSFCQNSLLKFEYKFFLAQNPSIDEVKRTSKPRIWKKICCLAFCKLHYKVRNFNDNISKNDIYFNAFLSKKTQIS